VVTVLVDNPVLLLFLVVGAGAALGEVRIRGVALGPAGALFVGLAVSAYDERLVVPAAIQSLGLALFVYTVGLASGPGFLPGLRRGGARLLTSVAAPLALTAAAAWLGTELIDGDRGVAAGLFSGVGTNTPALAAAIDALDGEGTDPVVGYSLAYPMAVLATIAAAARLTAVGRDSRSAGRDSPRGPAEAAPAAAGADSHGTVTWTVVVERDGLPELGRLRAFYAERLAFGRYRHDTTVALATDDVVLQPGDLVTVVGPRPHVEAFASWAGRRSDEHLPLDRSRLDFRRIVLSRRDLAGSTIGELDLSGRFGATITRVRRGDADLVARDDLVLNLGDRVRVVAPRDRMGDVARVLGDSDRSLAEVDPVALAIGVAAGIALGLVPIPIPSLGDLRLGLGGGALVSGLVLGALARTGPLTWQVPQAANLLLRQIGTLSFLACVGTASGPTFADAVSSASGARTAGLAAALCVLSALVLVASTRLLARRRRPADAAGFLAGVQTQPAVLAFATTRVDPDEAAAAYALVLPLAIVAKIVLVQALV